MTEAVLKAALVKLARESLLRFVVQRHEDRITHGTPDMSIDGNKIGSWWEIKHGTPEFKSRGIQELTMSRLEIANNAFYIVYWEKGSLRRTYIVEPKFIGNEVSLWNHYTVGFDHRWVIEFIKEVHHVNHNGS